MRRVLSTAGFGLLTLLTAALGASGSAFFVVGALLLAHLTAFMAGELVRRKPRAGGGGVFPYAWWPYYWLTAVLLLTVAEFVLLFARRGGWIGPLAALAWALFVAWFLITLARTGRGVVRLTSDGIFHRSLMFEHFAPWDTVTGVHTIDGRIPRIVVGVRPISTVRERSLAGPLSPGAEGLPSMVVRALWLGRNARPALDAIRFYLDHPSERAALGRDG